MACLFKFILFVSLICNNIQSSEINYPYVQCLPPEGLIHYRDVDMRNPCRIECLVGPHEYCRNGTLLFCDDDNTKCECKDRYKVCDQKLKHELLYRRDKCYCKYLGVFDITKLYFTYKKNVNDLVTPRPYPYIYYNSARIQTTAKSKDLSVGKVKETLPFYKQMQPQKSRRTKLQKRHKVHPKKKHKAEPQPTKVALTKCRLYRR